jgi:hypothetical protein
MGIRSIDDFDVGNLAKGHLQNKLVRWGVRYKD